MMSLPAMSLGLRFCVSGKGGTGGGGWVHPKGANSVAAHLGSSLKMTWLALEEPFLHPKGAKRMAVSGLWALKR